MIIDYWRKCDIAQSWDDRMKLVEHLGLVASARIPDGRASIASEMSESSSTTSSGSDGEDEVE